MTAHRKMTQAELAELARAEFGNDPLTYAFKCPHCGDVARIGEWPDDLKGRAGQECIGRSLGALKRDANYKDGKYRGRGCDWVAYGLFRGPWEIVMPDGHSAWSFPLALAEAEVPA